MIKIITLIGIVFTCIQLNAQVILLHDDVKADSVEDNYGPNYKHYMQLFCAYGGLFGRPAAPGAAIKQPNSFFLDGGLRYKRKINNTYSLILDAAYHLQDFSLKQDKVKTVPDNAIHDKEKLAFNNMGLSFYNRFNFGRRGNVIGSYIDVGVNGDFMFRATHVTRDKNKAPGSQEVETVIKQKGLTFVQNYGYSLVVRFGHNAFSLLARYRLSGLFKTTTAYPELPRFMLGIELSTM